MSTSGQRAGRTDFGISAWHLSCHFYLTSRYVAANAIRQILRHLGLPADPVELAPARAPGLKRYRCARPYIGALNCARRLICLLPVSGKKAFVANADQLGMEVIGMLWEVGVGRFC